MDPKGSKEDRPTEVKPSNTQDGIYSFSCVLASSHKFC